MNHPIPYAGNGSDLIKWFSGYYKSKFGYYLPNSQWSKQSGFIMYMKKKGYSLKEIATLIWGVTLESDKMRSLWYAKYYTDKLEKYKEWRKEYKEKQNKEEKEVEYDESQFGGDEKLDAGDYFKEFLE